jgi:hypothetical protein
MRLVSFGEDARVGVLEDGMVADTGETVAQFDR